jgi:hypothetical protein
MSCRRVAHELIEFFRFGDLDARSAPHLDHLEVCLACREEVGLDRELVLQLQRALQARVDGHAASPGAWLEIRRRALQPEAPSWRTRLLPVFRLAPVGAVLIVLLAVIVPVAGFSPFRAQPEISSFQTWQNFAETAVNDPIDPYDGRWWLRYTSPPPPSEPPTGPLPGVDPDDRLVALAEPASGPTQ